LIYDYANAREKAYDPCGFDSLLLKSANGETAAPLCGRPHEGTTKSIAKTNNPAIQEIKF